MPSPEASAPTRFCVQGREAVLVGAGAGIKHGQRASPSRLTELRRRPRRGPQACSCSGSLTAPMPRVPPNVCRGGRGRLFVSDEFDGDIEQWARLGFIFIEKAGQTEHIQWEAAKVSAGDQYLPERIQLISLVDVSVKEQWCSELLYVEPDKIFEAYWTKA